MDIKYILLNGDWGNILHFPLEGWLKPCFFCNRPTGRSYIYNNYKLFCCKDCFNIWLLIFFKLRLKHIFCWIIIRKKYAVI